MTALAEIHLTVLNQIESASMQNRMKSYKLATTIGEENV